jgi:hypothetical protein
MAAIDLHITGSILSDKVRPQYSSKIHDTQFSLEAF